MFDGTNWLGREGRTKNSHYQTVDNFGSIGHFGIHLTLAIEATDAGKVKENKWGYKKAHVQW